MKTQLPVKWLPRHKQSSITI